MLGQAAALNLCRNWFEDQGWKPFSFQIQAWSAALKCDSGMVNAPTGSGKTYSLLLPAIAAAMGRSGREAEGVQLIWITPIRALAREIEQSARRAIEGMDSHWEVGTRTGDTSQKVKQAQKTKLPQILITTPESIHVMLSNKGYAKLFRNLETIVID